MTRVGVGRWLGGGVEGAEWSAGESGSVVMITGGGLLRDMVEPGSWEEAGRKEGAQEGLYVAARGLGGGKHVQQCLLVGQHLKYV